MSTNKRTARATLFLVMVASVAPKTFAHSLLLSRGLVRVEPHQVVVELKVYADDLLHFYSIKLVSDAEVQLGSLSVAAERFRSALADALVIVDALGERIACKGAELKQDWPSMQRVAPDTLRQRTLQYTLRYPLDANPHYLTFRLEISDALAGSPMQAALLVRGVGAAGERMIRLTSGGNAETVELLWKRAGPQVVVQNPVLASDPCLWDIDSDPARFTEVLGRIVLDQSGLNIEFSLPVRLLETWIPVKRANRDSLRYADWKRVRNEVAALVEQAVEIEIDGKRVMPTLLSLHLSDDAATARSAHADDDRRSVWTTRVRADLKFHTYSEPKAASMRWRLFNDVVLRASVSFRMLDECTQHLLSPYQATTSWHAG